MRLYRAMTAAFDGQPLVVPSARGLGVRPGADIPLAADGTVRPEGGGMSVVPADPGWLPRHRLPVDLGGTDKDPVWWIDSDELGASLIYRSGPAAPDRHGSSEPADATTFETYSEAHGRTRDPGRRLGRLARLDVMTMIESELAAAVRGERPLDALTSVLRRLVRAGESQDALLDELEQLRAVLRAEGREDAEDIVLEAMDFLTGFCSQHVRIT